MRVIHESELDGKEGKGEGEQTNITSKRMEESPILIQEEIRKVARDGLASFLRPIREIQGEPCKCIGFSFFGKSILTYTLLVP